MKLSELLQNGGATLQNGNVKVIARINALEVDVEIGGDLYCPYNQLTELTINQPIGGYLDCSYNQLTETPTYERLQNGQRGDNWIYADGILSHYSKIKKVKDITFYIGFRYTVAEQNDKYAHGNDMRSALLDLRFKLVDRDKSQYEDLTLDSKLSYDDAVVMYRVITGACSEGTKRFLEQHPEISTKKKYSIQEILDLTNGEYGSESIKKFFKGGKRNE